MSDLFDYDRFAEARGSVFKLTAPSGVTIELELVDVSQLKATESQESFSVIFLAPQPYRVEQGLYDIEHPSMGSMQLFLVPVGLADDGRLQLEAVFNLLRKKTEPANG
jgi:hypothetical protein